VVLDEADAAGLSFFVGNGFWGRWDDFSTASDEQANARRPDGIVELLDKFGRHESFVGWYWPDEAEINPLFSPSFIDYVNRQSAVARELDASKKTLIAPYGTNKVRDGDLEFVRQLRNIDVDIIAYQDEVGVRKTGIERLESIWGVISRAHSQAPRIRLWADVEIFDFEGEVYKSALAPAELERISFQIETAARHVEKVLVYQYQGMLNPASSPALCGHPRSTDLYAGLAGKYIK